MKTKRVKFEIEFEIEGEFKPARKDELQDGNILEHLGYCGLTGYTEIKKFKYSRIKKRGSK